MVDFSHLYFHRNCGSSYEYNLRDFLCSLGMFYTFLFNKESIRDETQLRLGVDKVLTSESITHIL